MNVKNINGTSQKDCSCGSWLDHWKNYSRQQIPTYCPEEKCSEKKVIGAHVQKDSSIDRNWYIVPLCQAHNKKVASLKISDSVNLVSANVSETCAKPKTKKWI